MGGCNWDLVALSLYLLGITALKVHGSIVGAVMLQTGSVLISRFMIYRLVGATDMAMLLALTFLLMTLMILYLQKKSQTVMLQIRWPIMFGLLLSLMLMTKFTVLPLMIIPLIILTSWKSRIYYLTILLFMSILLLTVFVYNPEVFWNWIWKAVTRSGDYGGGSVGFDFQKSIDNAFKTFKSDPLFIIIFFVLIGIIIKSAISGYQKSWKGIYKNMTIVSLIAICFAALGQWLVVVKMFRQYYLLPASLLLMLGVYLYWAEFYRCNSTKKNAVRVGISSIVFLIVFQVPQVYSSVLWRKDFSDSCREIENYIRLNYANIPFITVNAYINKSHALLTFPKYYSSPPTAKAVIKKIYPQEIALDGKNLFLAEILAKSFPIRPSLAIVKNDSAPENTEGLVLVFKGKYNSIYILN